MSPSVLDTAWYLTINQFARATPALHGFLAGYALWGGPLLLAALLVLAWWRARDCGPAAVATVVLTGIGAAIALLACQDLLSELIARARPCATLPRLQVLLTCSPDYSMPSDHAAIAGAIAAGLWLVHRRSALAATASGLLLAFSRVYAGVHYPGDVLVGMLLGAVITLVTITVLRRPFTRAATALAGTRVAALVTTTAGTRLRHGTSHGPFSDDAGHRADQSRHMHLWTRPTMLDTHSLDPL